jgi:hypothetical protein
MGSSLDVKEAFGFCWGCWKPFGLGEWMEECEVGGGGAAR